jgi:hypothetical protein
MRIRHPKRGRRRRSGRHGYDTPWKEPWLLIVYVVDDKGRLDKRFSPWIDGTLRGPDDLFAWLEGYLRGLGLTQADRLLFIADGAPWIWKRVQTLRMHLGLGPEQALEAVDFYHAVEHLAAAAKETAWTELQRRLWVREQRRCQWPSKLIHWRTRKVIHWEREKLFNYRFFASVASFPPRA